MTTLAGAIEEVLPPDNELVLGVVTDVTPLTVEARGGIFTPGVLGSYAPAIGDNVELLRQDATWLALGVVRDATAGAAAYGGPMRPVRRGRRESDSTANAAEQSVLRVDNIPQVMGNLYFAWVPGANMVGTVAADRGNMMLRLNSTGVATTASPLIQASNSGALLASVAGSFISAGATWVSAINGSSASVLMSTARFVGTGTIRLQGSATFPVELLIYDLGPDIGDTGVDL